MRIIDNYSCGQKTTKVRVRNEAHQGKTGIIFGVRGSLQHGPRLYNVEFEDKTTAEFVGNQLDIIK